MLEEFRVENFKNFNSELVFNLKPSKKYEFNTDLVKNSIVNKALVYGHNGSGKSNLGLAILDISNTLTDKEKNKNDFNRPFGTLASKKNKISFQYRFKFDTSYLLYKYDKDINQNLLYEEVLIDDEQVISYDHKHHLGEVHLIGAETLNKNLNEKNISFVKYIRNNTVLTDSDKKNMIFHKFIDFVDNMLLFSSLERNHYQGYTNGSGSVAQGIIDKGKLKDFEEFLRKAGIDYKLGVQKRDGNKIIICDFNGKTVDFYSVASRGTCTLALFYFWLLNLDTVSLVFIDEFDAFYHNDLAWKVIEEVKKRRAQAIITTHNTSVMDNELLRPDCLFNLENGEIKSFAESTTKDLRKAHNIEKMYRAGAFDE